MRANTIVLITSGLPSPTLVGIFSFVNIMELELLFNDLAQSALPIREK